MANKEQTVVIKENKNKPYDKHYGKHPSLKSTDEEGVEKYLSYAKNQSFFIDDSTVIEFADRLYFTKDKEEIKFLDNNSQLGVLFWKTAFPKDVNDKFKEESRYLTRLEDDFTKAE